MSQREGFWQRVEEKARLHPEWNKVGGEFRDISYAEDDELGMIEGGTENENLTYDRLEQETRDVSAGEMRAGVRGE